MLQFYSVCNNNIHSVIIGYTRIVLLLVRFLVFLAPSAQQCTVASNMAHSATSIAACIGCRDAPILLFFSPIFLSGNSFFSNLLCSIFCSKFQHFAQSLAK